MATKEIDSKFMKVIKKDDLSEEELNRLAEFKISILRDLYALNRIGKGVHNYE